MRSLFAGIKGFSQRQTRIKKICILLPSLLLPAALMLLLSGCSRTGQTGPTDFSAGAPAEEDRLIIYTSFLEDNYAPIIKEFEERTGIWVQVETGGSIELLERIAAEADAPRCDLIFGGGVESLYSYRSWFSPYISSLDQTISHKYRQTDGLWTPFSTPTVVLIYNTKLIRTNPPAGWESLLDPAWRGKIAFADPESSASSYTALSIMLQALPGSRQELIPAFFRNLEGRTLERAGQVVGEVANGSCYIGITLEENALRGIKNGYDIAMVYPAEGTAAVPDGLAVIAGSRHEENARRFIDFALDKDVQTYISDFCNLRPVRSDVPQPEGVAQEFPVCSYDILAAGSQQEEILIQWRSLKKEMESNHPRIKEVAP